MKMKRWKAIAGLLAAVMILNGFPAAAFASPPDLPPDDGPTLPPGVVEYTDFVYAARAVRLYTEPTRQSKVRFTAAAGTLFRRTQTTGAWSGVKIVETLASDDGITYGSGYVKFVETKYLKELSFNSGPAFNRYVKPLDTVYIKSDSALFVLPDGKQALPLLYAGTACSRWGTDGPWSFIEAIAVRNPKKGAYFGFVKTDALSAEQPVLQSENETSMIATRDTLHMRLGPGTKYPALWYTLSKGERVAVIGKTGAWYKIKADDYVAFVYAKYLVIPHFT